MVKKRQGMRGGSAPIPKSHFLIRKGNLLSGSHFFWQSFPSKMIEGTSKLIHKGIEMGAKVNVLVNNRAGGNAPLIARMIGEKFLRQG
jgi:hypothetical protein